MPLNALRVSLCCLIAIAAASPAAADWKRIDTPNFVVIGDVSQGDLRSIARKFEGFRETLSRVLTDKVTATAVPTVVMIFPSDRAFAPFKPRFNGKPIELSGWFQPSQDANFIALAHDADDANLRIVFHEYAHLVISNVTRAMPLWLNEGLAEFYSTFEMMQDGRDVLIGRPVANHLALLNASRALPLEELLKVHHDSPLYNEGNRRSVFYGQSWALTHPILLGEPSRRDQLAVYLNLIEKGQPEMEAWKQAFGTERIDSALDLYIRRQVFRAYRYKFEAKVAAVDAPIRSLSLADADAMLTMLQLHQERYDEAVARLDAQAKTGVDSAWSETVRALVETARKDYARAEPRLTGVDVAGDWLLAYFAGVGIADLVQERGDPPTPALQDAAMRHLASASAGRGEIPNALARRVTIELAKRERPSDEVRTLMERAVALAPGRHDYRFMYANVLGQQSAYVAAATVLRSLTGTMYPPHVRSSAEALLAQIENIRKLQTMAAAGNVVEEHAMATAAAPASGSRSNGRSNVIHVLRKIEAGEQRFEGVFEHIECTPKGMRFRIRTADGAATVHADKLDQVDFITYRDDLSGSVNCGDQKPSMPVYVTWRPAADGSPNRIVIAIEFLPKRELQH